MVWHAANNPRDLIYGGSEKLQRPQWWMDRLLSDADARLPKASEIVVLSATDTEAIIKANDTYQIIYGRVSGVHWSSDGGGASGSQSGYLRVYFVGTGHLAATFRHATWQPLPSEFGKLGEGLVGKLIRVEEHIRERTYGHKAPDIPDWFVSAVSGIQ